MPASTLIDEMIDVELARFSVNDYRGLAYAPEFEVVAGTIPVMLSAPHAVTHWRDGRSKPSDDYTGSIALAVARLTGAHAIVATRFSHADPNWDQFGGSSYKQALVGHVRENGIRLVIDLHGMVAASQNLVAIGTADGETCRAWPEVELLAFQALYEGLCDVRERYGKGVALNPARHGARGGNTVARTVARECEIAALQVELATQVRVPSSRGLHIPKDDPAPFAGDAKAQELLARRSCDPDAVEACVLALAGIARDAAEAVSGAVYPSPKVFGLPKRKAE